MQPRGPLWWHSQRRQGAPRRAGRRLIAAFSLLTVAMVPAGPSLASLVPTDLGFGPFITVLPEETTLGQFTQFSVSGSNLPAGLATIRLRGVVAGSVQVPSAGGFGPIDLTVPTGAAACGTDAVTVDGTNAQATVTVLCPVLAVTPNPVFSAGTATNLTIAGTGFADDRTINLTLDGNALPDTASDVNGDFSGVALAGSTLPCGAHQLTATIQPPPGPQIRSLRAPAPADITFPLPAVTTTINVLGCATSSPPPEIFADPIETGIDQFTRFSVIGFDLAAGPATIKLGGTTAGTVTVASDGTFPQTDFTVPAGAATCGQDPVTIDDISPAIARTTINVFCPAITVTPDPVFSGGAAADLSIAGTGFPGGRPIDFTIDARDVGTVTSNPDGSVSNAVPGIALACGDHQVTATAQPLPSEPGIARRPGAVRAVVPIDPPIPATTNVTVLGCASSPTPPQIHAIPLETGIDQFTRFTVDGSLLPAGPATIKLGGVTAGTVQVSRAGVFPATDLPVPAGAAACGDDPVTIDNGGPVLATASISVFCPALTVAPDPALSGGGAAVLSLTGTGYPPNRPIDLGFDGQTHTTATSDATGTVHGTIQGITPACGQHQTTATAEPPAQAATLPQDFLPITASAPILVLGCGRIKADPSVIQQGTLTHVTGTGFLPRTPMTLTWQDAGGTTTVACAPDAVDVPALVSDAAGGIDVFCLALPHLTIGVLRLVAVQGPEQESAPVLVVDDSMQPSNGDQFVFRR